MKIPDDNYTSTVDGAAGYERMRQIEEKLKFTDLPRKWEERDYDKPEPWEENNWARYDEMKENDEFECNCSDPSCPCNGLKIGGL